MRTIGEQNAAVVPLHAARIAALGPGALVIVEGVCGRTERLTARMLATAGAGADDKIADLARDCDVGNATTGERGCRSGGLGRSRRAQGATHRAPHIVERPVFSFDCWPDPMLTPSIQRQLPRLAEHIVRHFRQSDWLSIGVITGCLELVREHPRLLRSLTWRDPDYEGNALAVLIQIVENSPQNLTMISDYIVQKYPSAREGVNVSSRPIPGREIYFTPSVFEVPAQGVDQTLVAVMTPFAAEYREVYEAIQSAAAFHGLNCRRVDDIWEHAILIQDIFSLIFRSYVVVCDFSGRNPNVFYETGIAHTLGKHVIPITQSSGDVPFDLRHHRYILYHNNGEGRAKLQQQLQRRLAGLFEL